jgi:DNA-binding IclR family transcriptional regulator
VTGIARALDIAKGTACNHLNTLERNGCAVRNDDGEHGAGFRFLDPARHAGERGPIDGIVRDELDRLAERSGEMAVFAVEEHGEGVRPYRARGERAVRTELYAGYRAPLHAAAVRKAILARLLPGAVDAIVEERGLSAVTDATITDRERLREEPETPRRSEAGAGGGAAGVHLGRTPAGPGTGRRPCRSMLSGAYSRDLAATLQGYVCK